MLNFNPPMFPNGGFVASKPFASQAECEKSRTEIGLFNKPSYSAFCVGEDAAK
jgi:hypothetical protein